MRQAEAVVRQGPPRYSRSRPAAGEGTGRAPPIAKAPRRPRARAIWNAITPGHDGKYEGAMAAMFTAGSGTSARLGYGILGAW